MVQQGSPQVEAKLQAAINKMLYDPLIKEVAEVSFKAGQEDEKAKVKGIYKDAGDLKELENRIREYLNE